MSHRRTTHARSGVIDSILKIRTSADTVEIVLVTEHCETPAMGALDSSQGFDWSSELGDLELVKPGSINSHYASLSFKTIGLGAVIAVISLARVSPPGAAR